MTSATSRGRTHEAQTIVSARSAAGSRREVGPKSLNNRKVTKENVTTYARTIYCLWIWICPLRMA